jgi:lipoate-protein ligase A
MRYLDLTLQSLADNLALDEALLLGVEAGETEVLRFWEWPAPAVVLGSASRLVEDVKEDVCQTDGVAILRRSSGGGTVLLGPGCLVYALVLTRARAVELQGITTSYRYIFATMQTALKGMAPGIAHAGTSDLASQGKKFSGNSQQRKRRSLLHHGTLLYAFNHRLVERYLRQPARQPEYRQGRPHLDFIQNLQTDGMELRQCIRKAWQADEPLETWPMGEVERLVSQKYSRSEWVRRR